MNVHKVYPPPPPLILPDTTHAFLLVWYKFDVGLLGFLGPEFVQLVSIGQVGSVVVADHGELDEPVER